jgi:hypothetical protein
MALALKADHFRNGSCVTSVVCPYGKRNFTEDEGGPFEFGNQVLIPSHRKLLAVAKSDGDGARVSEANGPT